MLTTSLTLHNTLFHWFLDQTHDEKVFIRALWFDEKKELKKEKKMHCTKLKRDLKQSDPLSELMQN